MVKEIFLFPCNGNAIEAVDCIDVNEYTVKGFIDDTPEKQGLIIFDIEIFKRDILKKNLNAEILAVPGSPQSYTFRSKIIDELELSNNRFATIIHPKAVISPYAKIGYNVLIMAGVVITSNAVIGNHVIILPNTVIHHDTVIGDHTIIGSNVCIASNTNIDNNCYIGSGSSIINGVNIGKFSMLGLGSNVISDFPDRSKVVGNPARKLGLVL